MNRESLVDILEEIWYVHLLGTAGSILYMSDRGIELLDKSTLSMYGRSQDLKTLANLMKDKQNKGISIVKFNHVLRDYLLREPFSYVKEYCENTKQENLLKAEEWYEFSRILRNYLSHGKQFNLDYYNKDQFPIKWKNNVIEWPNMEQNQINFNDFEHTMVLDLFEEMKRFAQNLK